MRSVFLGGLSLAWVLWLLPATAFGWTAFWNNGYCQKSGRRCSATIGNAGGSGACCDPLRKEVTTCVKEDPCVGTHQIKWGSSKLPLPWQLSENEMTGKAGYKDLTKEAIEAIVKKSWEVWTVPACTSFTHKYGGLATTPPDSFDGKLTIHLASEAEWAALGAGSGGVLAFAVRRSDGKGQLFDGDIMVNPAPGKKRWGGETVANTEYDLAFVLSHEIGHSLGFGHTPLNKDLMYFAVRGTGPLFGPLGDDEIAAICTTYPKENSCKEDADCGPCRRCSEALCKPSNPASDALCKPCKEDTDCGTGGKCLDGAGGGRCVQPCGDDGCCPDGYRCSELTGGKLCVPITGQCAAVSCQDDAACGRDGVCKDGACASNAKFDRKACAAGACEKDADCANGLTCKLFSSSRKRCLNSCFADAFCPDGYSCRRIASGERACVPHSFDFCPCLSDDECPQGQTCDKRRCKPYKTAKEGELCSDAIPCEEGFRCSSIAGNRCLRDCIHAECPKGRVCVSFSVNIKFCLGEAVGKIGEACDNIGTRCKEGLQCMQNTDSSTSGICIQQCQHLSQCSKGDLCTKSSFGIQYCGCDSDDQCKERGMACKDLGREFKICVCENPPCKSYTCGNLICDRAEGENCSTCPKDCICGSTDEVCLSGTCLAPGQCVEEKDLTCDKSDPNCKPACAPGACGCQSTSASSAPLPLLLLLVALLIVRRRHHSVG